MPILYHMSSSMLHMNVTAGHRSGAVPCLGYLAYPFQNQEVNGYTGNFTPPTYAYIVKEKDWLSHHYRSIWNGYTE